jgi:hypothetical protein
MRDGSQYIECTHDQDKDGPDPGYIPAGETKDRDGDENDTQNYRQRRMMERPRNARKKNHWFGSFLINPGPGHPWRPCQHRQGTAHPEGDKPSSGSDSSGT